MPPARVADPEVDFSGLAGNAMRNTPNFRASLAAAGPLFVGPGHWLALVGASWLPAPGSLGAASRPADMRIVVYVFMPAFVFTDALNAQPLLFWPFLAVVAGLLRALLDAGMPKDPLGSPAEGRRLVRSFLCGQSLFLPGRGHSTPAAL